MVRKAVPTKDELLALYTLLSGMHAEAGLGFPAIDPVRVMAGFHRCFETGGVWVVEEDGKIVGAIGLYLNQYWFSAEPYLADMFYYVAPEARTSKAAKALLNEAKAFAAEVKLPLLIGILNANDLERKDIFMKRAGFKRAGAFYVLRG